jgi:undecaprenyl diphosphate synthase
VRTIIEECVRHGVGALTLFAFSSENWQRPAGEVGLLMQLFLESLDREVAELDANGVRIRFIGDRARLAPALLARMDAAEEKTAARAKLDLVIAVAYGGHWDIAQAARQLALEAKEGRLDAAAIDRRRCRTPATASRPSPDLFIRTGRQRINNFLLWDLAYTELWFRKRSARFRRSLFRVGACRLRRPNAVTAASPDGRGALMLVSGS